MRILLIGEYSRLHNSLKEGLLKLNHEVTLVGTSDGFKNLPVDYNYSARFFTKSQIKPLVKIIDKVFKINLIEHEYAWRFSKIIRQLKGYDVVQLINENSIKTTPSKEIKLLESIARNNNNLFLMSCGTDYTSVSYAKNGGFKYSILTPLFEDSSLTKHYKFILRYLTKPYIKLHEYIYNKIQGVIASDLDYHIPLKDHEKYLGMIPNPINTDAIKFVAPNPNGVIVIFHGINKSNYIKKGNRFFDEALSAIKEKYKDRVKIISTTNLPYNEFITTLDSCHIYLDQVYAYDQGFAALEAMAKGKVVFTGAEQEWLDYYNLQEDTVAINALPDIKYLVDKLEKLILNPDLISSISRNARDFVEKEHHYINVAEKYMDTWTSSATTHNN